MEDIFKKFEIINYIILLKIQKKYFVIYFQVIYKIHAKI